MLDTATTSPGAATADHTRSTTEQDGRAKRWHKALVDTFDDAFAKTFASPYVVRENQVFECPVVIRFYKKDFAFVSKQLYLEYQYRTWRGFNQELLARYVDLLTKKIENIKILMQNTINRVQNLMAQQGHKLDDSMWPNPMRKDVPIIAAHVNQYLEALRMLEKVYLLAGTANMFGVLDSAQRAEAEAICKKAVRAFRSVLQAEAIKLFREADRVMKEQRNAGTPLDPRLVETVEQHGKDAAGGAQQDDEDGPAGTGDEAGSLIDDAAAASTAASQAAKRPRRKAASEPAATPAEPAASTAA